MRGAAAAALAVMGGCGAPSGDEANPTCDWTVTHFVAGKPVAVVPDGGAPVVVTSTGQRITEEGEVEDGGLDGLVGVVAHPDGGLVGYGEALWVLQPTGWEAWDTLGPTEVVIDAAS